jgi:hypothetical protein
MGKTFKDQRKYEFKRRERDEDFARQPKGRKQRPYDEIIPEDDELDPYEELDLFDDYDR